LEKIKRQALPRTNPVNLIFVLAQYAPKVSEMHFFPPRDFFDLVMRSTLSSETRAKAFLWLMWWYLESDFTREAAINNPFGAGLDGEGTDGLPIKVPAFESLTEDQANLENVDTPEELEYGESKRLERKRECLLCYSCSSKRFTHIFSQVFWKRMSRFLVFRSALGKVS
jgi:hypothetical protein